MSIIFFPLTILVIAALSWYLVKNKKPLLARPLPKSIILFYGALLFLASFIVYALPDKDFVQQMSVSNNQSAEAREAADRLLDIVRSGELDSTNNVYLNFSQDFASSENQLELAIAEDFDGEVWIERKDSADGIIEVRSYLTSYQVENFDFTSEVKPPVIEYEGNTLEVRPQVGYTLEFRIFKDNFISAQFRGSTPSRSFGGHTVFGRQAVYVRIPQGMESYATQPNVVYLN